MLLVVLVWSCSTTARADFILNTGFESGALLTNGATVTDYRLVSQPAGSVTELIAVTSAGGFPVPPWIGDSAISTWIRPNNGSGTGQESDPAGQYIFETTFDLGSLDPTTASLSGRFATDNSGTVQLNGNDLVVSSSSFQLWSDIELTAGSPLFVSGENTLRFIVNNAAGTSGNPVGLRVELSFHAVPEPASPLLVAIFGGVLASCQRRRRP